MKKLLLISFLLTVFFALAFADVKIYDTGNEVFVPKGTEYTLSAEDSYSGFKKTFYRINFQEELEYSEPLVFNEDGSFTVVSYSVDQLNNVSKPRISSFIVDGLGPQLSSSTRGPAVITTEGKLYLRDTTAIILNAIDMASGVEQIYFSVEDDNYISYNEEAFVTQEGSHNVKAYAVDNVGNYSDFITMTAEVDNTAPIVSIFPREPLLVNKGEHYTFKGNSFSVYAEDKGVGLGLLEVSIDYQGFITYTGPVIFVEPGDHSIKVRATDKLGNVSAAQELTFIIDVTNPVEQSEFSIKSLLTPQ